MSGNQEAKLNRLLSTRPLTAGERRQAARYALGRATGAADALALLGVLGLVPSDALPRRPREAS